MLLYSIILSYPTARRWYKDHQAKSTYERLCIITRSIHREYSSHLKVLRITTCKHTATVTGRIAVA